MPSPAFDGLLHHLRSEPSRTWSLVITLFGDAIVPRGGAVWLGTVLEVLRALGTEDGAVRTAMSRLTADGWLERSRAGRNSFYRLAEPGRATFTEASEHIYSLRSPGWDGCLTLIMTAEGDHEGARAALAAAGFGAALPGLHIALPGTPVPEEARDAIRIEARCPPASARRLVGLAWPLDRVAQSYGQFVTLFTPLKASFDAGETLSDLEALAARVLMIHSYRRIVLRDPVLPKALVPQPWPGDEARRLCAGLYRSLLPGSENWLDAHGVDEAGPLPAAGPDLRRRFR
ncbi:phenylacetic acid degradation operon negative regulatory protein PaaX [Enterovirga sp.]|uniref:phenylacetic acid degradation operon negative regulatory protein PaaX n=1 Tax=Enterovirga sp. TaxID=2026350 RepID=UPI0026205C6D|nr:phenylacetic acid degradation operon negative regulatory protein PaaX [Enterovirga sp.]MDB5590394.1 transcriptional regulator, PaaX family [Enterovirga sp.]